MMSSRTALWIVVLVCIFGSALSFVGVRPLGLRSPACTNKSFRPSRQSVRMAIEQIEYIIHKDGRVEEKVTGVKGAECHEVTKEVEKVLGKVVYTTPTAERFEETVSVTNTVTQQETISQGQQKWGQY
uniref:DUF2997 domain-containing protein n=1 Tax=Cryptomonas curvata TaxID=233186 RepID=A0A7S0N198_9CRYP